MFKPTVKFKKYPKNQAVENFVATQEDALELLISTYFREYENINNDYVKYEYSEIIKLYS